MIVIVDEMKKFRELLDQNEIEWVDDSEALDTERYICRTHPKNHERWSVVNGFGTYGYDVMYLTNPNVDEGVILYDLICDHDIAEVISEFQN